MADNNQVPPRSNDPAEPRRPGFADLKKSNLPLYLDLRKVINVCVDPNDWGYLHGNGSSKPRANKKEVLNYWLTGANRTHPQAGHPRIRRLSLRRLELHCKGLATIYFTNAPEGQVGILLFDIDDKDGLHGDSHRVLDFLSFWLPSMYRQPSTFGRGSHGYVAVDRRGMSTGAFRNLCSRFEDVAADVVADHDFGSTFELKATPGELLPGGAYKVCGTLAKFPRLKSEGEMTQFINAVGKLYLPSVFEQFIREFRPGQHRPVIVPKAAPLLSSTSNIDMGTVPISIFEVKQGEETSALLVLGTPAERMSRCGWNLARKLGRVPTPREILQAYHDQRLNTGYDTDGNRARLAEHSARWLQQHFKPQVGQSYQREEYLALVLEHVKEEHREQVHIGNRSTFTDEQLAIVLYSLEKGSVTRHSNRRLQFTAPNNSLLAMLKTLGSPLEGKEDACRKKLSAMKRLLEFAGLIEVVEPRWTYGQGKKYGLGVKHPKRHDYVSLRDDIGGLK